MKFDLHIHSTYSDGLSTPEEIVDLCIREKIKIISITDHDEINGTIVGLNYAKDKDITFVPGVEISTDTLGEEVHLLSYCFDYRNKELIDALKKSKESRKNRFYRMIERLQELGFDLTLDELSEELKTGVLGRPHVADLMVKRGFVSNRQSAFDKYLGYGKPAYVPREKLSTEEAVSIVKKANGLAIIAHPGLITNKETKDCVFSLPIDGIEVWHPDHGNNLTEYYYNYAKKNGYICTGGSDWHGDKGLHNLGQIIIPAEEMERFMSSCRLT